MGFVNCYWLMSRFNPRLVAVVLFVIATAVSFKFLRPKSTDDFSQAMPNNLSSDWGKFAASDTKMTAFALLGTEDNNGKPQEWYAAQPKFYDEIVLSQTEVKNSENRRELREAFARIVPARNGKACIPNYRHALRLVKNERTLDAKICFDCGDIEITDKGKKGHFSFELLPWESRDKFDAVFARMGMKQWRPGENQ